MPEHNGDYSPKAEHKRKLKREKVQRSRIRKRIEEGRATAMEIAAIDAWERGENWSLDEQEPGGYAAQERPPRTRPVAQEEEAIAPIPWKGLGIVSGLVAACFGGMIWLARRSQS